MTAKTPAGRRRRLGGRLGGATAVVGVLSTSVVLASCSNSSATRLASQACRHVDRSIALYEQSLKQPASQQRATQQKAESELVVAEAPAAAAAGVDGHWQALMTDLSEAVRVPEGNLVAVLQLQCQQALPTATTLVPDTAPPPPPGPNAVAPNSPGTTPGTTPGASSGGNAPTSPTG